MTLFQSHIAKVLLVLAVAGAGVAWAAGEQDQALIERIKAVGEVCKSGANCDAAAPAAGATGGGKSRTGADIATKHCVMCHGTPGVPGAPRTAAEWKPRLAAKGGIDGLTASATKGINAMPPKGMCMDCTPVELKAAVVELTSKAK